MHQKMNTSNMKINIVDEITYFSLYLTKICKKTELYMHILIKKDKHSLKIQIYLIFS